MSRIMEYLLKFLRREAARWVHGFTWHSDGHHIHCERCKELGLH